LRILAIVVAAIVGLVSLGQAQDLKLGYVQVERVMQDFPEHEDASRTYEKELQSWQTQLNEYQQQIAQLEEEFEQRAMLFSPEKKREKQEEMLSKRQEATKFYQDVFAEGGKAEQRQTELWTPIYAKINRAIEILGERENYSMIFNAQGLLYAQEALDVTAKVLEILKAGVDVSTSSGPSR
jgi:outer membrane protein